MSHSEEQWTEFALECARYVFDSDCEQISFEEHIRDDKDPRNHILYHAAVVLGYDEDFQQDIDDYLNRDVD